MYIQLISIHGLVRGNDIEMGRDSDTGGQVRYVIELAKTLGAMEEVAQVDLFTRQIKDKRVSADYAEAIEELGPKARIVRLPCGGGRYIRKEKLWPHLDDFVDAMVTFTRGEKRMPTVVHGHYADAGYIAREVASAFGVPFYFTGHSLGRDKFAYLESQGMSDDAIDKAFNMKRRIDAEERCLATADRVITSTSHERDTQYARYDAGQTPQFEIIPPGTELDRFFPYYEYELAPDTIDEETKQARMRMSRELGRFHFEPDRPLILALCRPDKRKNINALVQAYGEDKQLQSMANLAIFAGIRRDIEELEDSEREVLNDMLLMMDRYDLYGRMAIPKRHDSHRDVPELYRLTASKRGVFVNPAHVEPFGLTFIEASAVGLPFVGTHNGGPQDIVANCDSGLLVDVSDAGTLAEAIKQLLTDRELWEKCSDNGVNRVREHYAWETHCQKYIESIKEVVDSQPKPSFHVNRDSEAPAKRLAALDSFLITDIDNTLLGDEEALQRLKKLMAENREHLGFGVASGRYLDMVIDVLEEHDIGPLDLIVSSVGCEIYYGPHYTLDKGWASHLRSKWRPERVQEAMDSLPFVTLQKDEKTQREFKISYDLDESIPADDAVPLIHAALGKAKAAYSLIFSHGSFIDILAHRASKGKAVRYISTKWNIPLERIATAGDSGNDRDMLTGQTAGIIVGNYAPELESLQRSSARIYFAEAHHADGIIEGLRHFGIVNEGG